MNLTSLANVRSWVGSSTSTDDALLSRLIQFASNQILQYLQRPNIGLTTITEVISGKNTLKIQLRNWPVAAVTALSINGVNIPASTGPNNYGYALEAVYGGIAGRRQNLALVGSVPQYGGGYPVGWGYGASPAITGCQARPFAQGINNISATYSYGYAIQNEAQTIPASPYIITPNAPYGAWGGDLGVTFASNGAALTAVANSPITGQYVPPNLAGDTPTLTYLFAAADAGKGVLLNYNYVPGAIEQACIETVGERYRYKNRIGQRTQSIGGQETSSYDLSGLSKAVIEMLAPYEMEGV